jgi:electron transfer flavoprotein alpha subunit
MILVFAEQQEGTFKKVILEALTYGKKLAEKTDSAWAAMVWGSSDNINDLSAYGCRQIYHVEDPALDAFDSQQFTRAIASVADEKDAHTLVLGHTAMGKSLAGRLAVQLKAGIVSGANALPGDDFVVGRDVFSGKAVAYYKIESPKHVISVNRNAVAVEEEKVSSQIEKLKVDLGEKKTKVVRVDKVEGKVPLPEAELVVSGGRGLKGPENWHLIEGLADVLGAATACSRPVADSEWRPHHEHVGQTGLAIRPGLYLAVGISGAIQHLAGVNNSKTIVVINKDPEAPFFKAADYGVCADLFDVVPRLTEAVKRFKSGK